MIKGIILFGNSKAVKSTFVKEREQMKGFIRRLEDEEVIRYLFFGACTTGVNFAVFSFLRYWRNVPVNMANLVSIVSAVIFAFFVNHFYVFRVEEMRGRKMLMEFADFMGMRIGTLLIEYWGVWFLSGYKGCIDWVSKGVMQVIVILLNYVISKYMVFKVRQVGGASE